jgi:hypothetical protein
MTQRTVQAHQESREAQGTTDALRSVERLVESIPLLRGRQVKRVTLAASSATTTIDHGLGRMPQGWVIVRATVAAPVVYESSMDARRLILVHTDATSPIVDLWVY